MIDLHNHILAGVDDGAADLDESLEIARQFVSEGVTCIAATPHLDPTRGTGPSRLEVERRVSTLQDALETAGIDLTILPGQEVFLTPEAPELLGRQAACPLGDSTAVLVECSFDQRPLYLEDTLYRLQLAGYQPILAHPERYTFVQRDIDIVEGLVSRDIVLQLTAPSLLGEYGHATRRVAERLLARGAYALAASDRHHPGVQRSLAELYDRITELGNRGLADRLLRENPQRVLNGQPPLQADPIARERQSLISRIWRRGS